MYASGPLASVIITSMHPLVSQFNYHYINVSIWIIIQFNYHYINVSIWIISQFYYHYINVSIN